MNKTDHFQIKRKKVMGLIENELGRKIKHTAI